VAPFNRGFAPTELPDDRHHVHSSTMVADQIALHEALGGDEHAILIAHDWGAVGAWGAAGKEPARWRRCIILNIPPFPIFGVNIVKYDQIKRSFYFWYFQMQRVCEDVISAGDFAFIDRIWADWSPGSVPHSCASWAATAGTPPARNSRVASSGREISRSKL